MAYKIATQKTVLSVKDQKGLTLVELMVALALLGGALVFIQVVFLTQHRSYTIQEDVSEAQQDVRVSLGLLARDIRSAGYGISTGAVQTAIELATDLDDLAFPNDPNPDSITINVASGPTTYFLAQLPGNVIQVDSASDFAIGDTVNIVNLQDLNQILPGNFAVNAVDPVTVPNTLTLGAAPLGGMTGNIVVSPIDNIVYCLIPDPDAAGTFILARAIGVPCADPVDVEEEVASNIQDLQFSYIMNDGTEVNTVAAGNLNDIQLVRITLVSQTTKEVAKDGGNQQRTRQLSTLVEIKNLF